MLSTGDSCVFFFAFSIRTLACIITLVGKTKTGEHETTSVNFKKIGTLGDLDKKIRTMAKESLFDFDTELTEGSAFLFRIQFIQKRWKRDFQEEKKMK